MTARWLRAGIAYFAAVFAVAFLLGVIRVLVVIPRIGEMPAAMVEIPVLLTFAWIRSRKTVLRYAVPARAADRLAMGCLALLLTLLAEAAISLFLAGRTMSEHLELYRLAHVQIGLAAQCLFGLFPAIQNQTA